MPIVRWAAATGVGVNVSLYTDAKNGNGAHVIGKGDVPRVDDLVRELLAFKKVNRRVITNSDYYLEQIPRYVRGQMTEPCRSGIRTIHIDPSGFVKRCPDFPTDFHWRDFARYKPVNCNACYYACRGEAQAPLTLSRMRDIMA
jgi:MoaA/NifB/PqqE/SkfB family radical SAM enzyme